MALARDPKIRFICLDMVSKNGNDVMKLNKIIDTTSLDTDNEFIKKLLSLYEQAIPDELTNKLVDINKNGDLYEILSYIKNNLNDDINVKNLNDVKLKYFKWNYYRSRQARQWVLLSVREEKDKKNDIQNLIGMACIGSHKIPNITLDKNMTVNIAHLFIQPKYKCEQSYKFLLDESTVICESNNLIPTILCEDDSLRFYKSSGFKEICKVNNKYHFMVINS